MADYKKSSVHCHSTMCDGKNTLQDMASAACAQGLTTLGFTGHSYTQRDREYCMSPSRTAQYKATIAKLKTEYKGKVDILCGIEWDILSEDKRTGYDYWIGSAHHLYGKNTGKYYEIDFRPQDLWDCINDDFDADPLAAVEAYFAEVEKVAALKPDILAHIDLIKKLNANGEFFDEESPRYKAAALKALQAAKDNDCLLEVNTGGVYRGYRKDFYPGAWLLGEWQKMSGRVIITSDNPRFEEPQDIINDMLAGLDAEDMRKTLSIADRKEAIRTACMLAEKGDVILVAGKGHENYQEIKGVKHHFDDKEILKEIFK